MSCNSSHKNSSETELKENNFKKDDDKSVIFENDAQDNDFKNIIFQSILNAKERKDKKLLKSKLLQSYKQIIKQDSEIKEVYRTNIYGSEDSLWIVEIDQKKDSTCISIGNKVQLLFNGKGNLIHIDSAAYLKWIKFKKEAAPLLMTLNTDCSGKGKHHFYKFENGSLIDIFNVLLDNTPFTYDSEIESDNANFQPAELEFNLEDLNNDNQMDIVFSGIKQIYDKQNFVKTQSLKYFFIYEPNEDWFVLKNSDKTNKSPKKPFADK